MPFSRSRSVESRTRSPTSSFSRNEPDCQSIASTRVVLPWSTWATIATLRRSLRRRRAIATRQGSRRCGYLPSSVSRHLPAEVAGPLRRAAPRTGHFEPFHLGRRLRFARRGRVCGTLRSRRGLRARCRSSQPVSSSARSSSSTTARTARSFGRSARMRCSAPRSASLVYTPFAVWRREHAIHHATAGDLDRRGVGDVQTLTVDEYRASPWWERLRYRLFRNPFVMFGLGPFWVVLLGPRVVSWSAPQPAAAERARHRPHSRSRSSPALVLACRLGGILDRAAAGAPRQRQRRHLALLRAAPVRGHLLAVGRDVVVRRCRPQGQLAPATPAAASVLDREHRPAPRPPSERADPELQPAGRPRRERAAPQRPDDLAASTACGRHG